MKDKLFVLSSIMLLIGCSNPEQATVSSNPVEAKVTLSGPTDLIIATGKIEPENEIVTVSSSTGGIIRKIFKKDGEVVQQGEILVQLEDDLELRKISEIQTQIQSQQSQVLAEQTQLREIEVNLSNKKSLLAKTKRLLEKGAETQQTFDDLSTEIGILELSLNRAQVKIRLANDRINELNAQLKTAETEVQKKQLKSPYNGVVLDMQVSEGEAVNQFAQYAELAPQGNLIVRAEVDELFCNKVKKGQKVELFFTGSDKVIATGEVIMTSPYLKKKSLFSEKADDQEDRRVREIHISLNDVGDLIINAKVECKIKL